MERFWLTLQPEVFDGLKDAVARQVDAYSQPRCVGRHVATNACSNCAATSPRPALSHERVQLTAAGQVELKLKTPWHDGATHLVMSPLEFRHRRAALM